MKSKLIAKADRKAKYESYMVVVWDFRVRVPESAILKMYSKGFPT